MVSILSKKDIFEITKKKCNLSIKAILTHFKLKFYAASTTLASLFSFDVDTCKMSWV